MRTITLSEARRIDPKARVDDVIRVPVDGKYQFVDGNKIAQYVRPVQETTIVEEDGVTWTLNAPIGPVES